jgi:hypothetical protein
MLYSVAICNRCLNCRGAAEQQASAVVLAQQTGRKPTASVPQLHVDITLPSVDGGGRMTHLSVRPLSPHEHRLVLQRRAVELFLGDSETEEEVEGAAEQVANLFDGANATECDMRAVDNECDALVSTAALQVSCTDMVQYLPQTGTCTAVGVPCFTDPLHRATHYSTADESLAETVYVLVSLPSVLAAVVASHMLRGLRAATPPHAALVRRASRAVILLTTPLPCLSTRRADTSPPVGESLSRKRKLPPAILEPFGCSVADPATSLLDSDGARSASCTPRKQKKCMRFDITASMHYKRWKAGRCDDFSLPAALRELKQGGAQEPLNLSSVIGAEANLPVAGDTLKPVIGVPLATEFEEVFFSTDWSDTATRASPGPTASHCAERAQVKSNPVAATCLQLSKHALECNGDDAPARDGSAPASNDSALPLRRSFLKKRSFGNFSGDNSDCAAPAADEQVSFAEVIQDQTGSKRAKHVHFSPDVCESKERAGLYRRIRKTVSVSGDALDSSTDDSVGSTPSGCSGATAVVSPSPDKLRQPCVDAAGLVPPEPTLVEGGICLWEDFRWPSNSTGVTTSTSATSRLTRPTTSASYHPERAQSPHYRAAYNRASCTGLCTHSCAVEDDAELESDTESDASVELNISSPPVSCSMNAVDVDDFIPPYCASDMPAELYGVEIAGGPVTSSPPLPRASLSMLSHAHTTRVPSILLQSGGIHSRSQPAGDHGGKSDGTAVEPCESLTDITRRLGLVGSKEPSTQAKERTRNENLHPSNSVASLNTAAAADGRKTERTAGDDGAVAELFEDLMSVA